MSDNPWTMRFHKVMQLAAQRGPGRKTIDPPGIAVGICSLHKDQDPDSPFYTIQGDGERTPRWLSDQEAQQLATDLGMDIEGIPGEVIEGTAVDITDEEPPVYGETTGMGPGWPGPDSVDDATGQGRR